MQEKMCQILLKKRMFRKESKSLLDEKTIARINREDLETWKGLRSLRKEQKIDKKEDVKLSLEDLRESAKRIEENEIHSAEESKEIETAKKPEEHSRKIL
ncbi:hypothetical protein ANTRET_LOCUS10176 [Anthophora retusa]